MNRIIIMCFLNKLCPKTSLKGTMTSVTDPIALIGYDPNSSNNACTICIRTQNSIPVVSYLLRNG